MTTMRSFGVSGNRWEISRDLMGDGYCIMYGGQAGSHRYHRLCSGLELTLNLVSTLQQHYVACGHIYINYLKNHLMIYGKGGGEELIFFPPVSLQLSILDTKGGIHVRGVQGCIQSACALQCYDAYSTAAMYKGQFLYTQQSTDTRDLDRPWPVVIAVAHVWAVSGRNKTPCSKSEPDPVTSNGAHIPCCFPSSDGGMEINDLWGDESEVWTQINPKRERERAHLGSRFSLDKDPVSDVESGRYLSQQQPPRSLNESV
ncbi:hypothetical protein CAPTEDRAFT_201302 [Capitella teleta]|uniref:Uncharacterized protein n=1 Tax=Capitella teleta TaxID=283909 RepID=R7UTC0_CAPTE|nr:hypothetical protein CAPTEDRAFT_201302 [Capitella teleta]|eukprot:ELU09413.1 hypothetical protein CAPTEDRAFT_201302 [Capitella teleta]